MDERVERNLQYQSFIVANVERYCRIFEKNEDKKIFVSANWAAFLFGPRWMFYRSMYAWGTIALFLEYLIAYIGMFSVVGLYWLGILTIRTTADVAAVYMNLMTGVVVAEILVRVAFLLFGDCIYRAFIHKNARYTDGGVTVVGFLIGVVADGVVGGITSTVLEVVIAFILMLVA